jgi:hypothetical protein
MGDSSSGRDHSPASQREGNHIAAHVLGLVALVRRGKPRHRYVDAEPFE